uniref:PHD-type domain-containing protein n=1 Tax=Musca domestica TaxID=7370 RepID=A0A905IF82_MUSDO
MNNKGEKTCDLCKQTSSTDEEDVILFGEWMTRSNITVHYYCLLLSTNLPQNGEDHGGILGFHLRDIRKEIKLATKRHCMYCNANYATIMCHGCKKYFHLICGHTNKCLSEFIGEFKSYCRNCVPLSDEQKALMKSNPQPNKAACYICRQYMGIYSPTNWISAKCCKNGYVHSLCLKKYALKAGYYLKCIWCKNKEFREDIKYMGIFVPDRDADWEREKDAYRDLHRSTKRCDMTPCNCPKGRVYTSPKWSIIRCTLCGLVGAHNPFCIPDTDIPVREFKCDTCSVTERTIVRTLSETHHFEEISDLDISLRVNKGPTIENLDEQCSSVSTEISNDSIATAVNPSLEGLIPHLTQNSEDLQTSKGDEKIGSIDLAAKMCEVTPSSSSHYEKNSTLHKSMNRINGNANDHNMQPATEVINMEIHRNLNQIQNEGNIRDYDMRLAVEDKNTANKSDDENAESDEDPPDYAIDMAVDHFLYVFGFK